ncbi:hypothetical protein GCK72_020946 [Caenorhabditis remanei]|uniref:F-box domain-containing protein n=1 Tax=Caenorhabditis remanei TaxID=31234 RepID=A0A6A5GIJ3_CAERE|nr:hypothetical protein GCK72_020946 [Caenorhabditis remanei]KAF1754385.1 hypothetical protein GCK72_020946 [Caenorhabditis remanei]
MYLNPEFKFAKLPWLAGQRLFRNMNVVDLMNIAQASPSTDWLTQIASVPTNFSVTFVSSDRFFQDHWDIRMDFRDNDAFIWHLWPNATQIVGARIKWMVGKHKLVTKIEKKKSEREPTIIHSFMVGFQKTLFEIVEWLEKLFTCKVTNINIPFPALQNCPRTARWSALRYSKNLTMTTSCADSEWIVAILKERYAQNCKTFIGEVEIGRPRDISVEALSSLTYRSGRLNFNLLSFDYFLEYVKNLMASDDERFLILRARIPDWTIEKVNEFAQKLELARSPLETLSRTHFTSEFGDFDVTRPMFQYNQSEDIVLAFNFLVKPGDLYACMAVVRWKRKSADRIEHERQVAENARRNAEEDARMMLEENDEEDEEEDVRDVEGARGDYRRRAIIMAVVRGPPFNIHH